MNEDALLKKATNQGLETTERAQIAQALSSRTSGLDHYTLLLAIGRSMATEHRAVVESFLGETQDPMLVKLALQILCKFWGHTEQYLDHVQNFISPQPWDEDEDVRQMAISVAGEYLREHRNDQLLDALIKIVEDADEDEFTRQDAYLSLARAMGLGWDELPQLSRLPPLAALVDEQLIEKARSRLGGA